MLKDSKYYSKILLFGEYGIIKDSMGLSIPYNDYNGTFIFSDKKTEFSAKSNSSLNKFYQHLLSLENIGWLAFDEISWIDNLVWHIKKVSLEKKPFESGPLWDIEAIIFL